MVLTGKWLNLRQLNIDLRHLMLSPLDTQDYSEIVALLDLGMAMNATDILELRKRFPDAFLFASDRFEAFFGKRLKPVPRKQFFRYFTV